MSVSLTRLRRWFGVAAIIAVLAVVAAYFYAHRRVENALKQVPAKMGLEIKQSATGFTSRTQPFKVKRPSAKSRESQPIGMTS